MLKKVIKTQVASIAWVASTIQQADLPRDGVITRIDLEVQITPSATLVGANIPMGVWHMIDTLRVVGGGGMQYVGMGSGKLLGRMIHAFNSMDFPGQSFLGPRNITAPNPTYVPAVFRLHFGSRPRTIFDHDNPFDLSAFIPAHKESSLKVEWGCPANSVLDAAVTITSAVMKITVYQVLGTELEIAEEMASQGCDPMSPVVPQSSVESYNHTGTLSDLSKQFDVPGGNYLRRIGIMADDATATPVLATDEITRVGLIMAQTNERLIDVDFSGLLAGNNPDGVMLLTNEGGAAVDTYRQAQPGIGILDMRPHWNIERGWNLTGKKAGDVKLGATIGTYVDGDKSYVFYDMLAKLALPIMG
jgi:hypothetical protein